MLPVRWMSPESVMYGRFTLESDIWSYGVVLWEIYSLGKQPYYGHTNEEVLKLILQGIMLIPPEDCPPHVCLLMKHCWKTEPRDRIKFPEILSKLEKALVSYDSVDGTKSEVARTLPRPPQRLPAAEEVGLLTVEDYLMPTEINKPAEYLQTLPG